MDKSVLKGCKSVGELYMRLAESEGLTASLVPSEISLNLLLARLVVANSSKTLFECLDEQIMKALPEAKDLYLLRESLASPSMPQNFGLRVSEIAIYELYKEQQNCSHRVVSDYLISVGMPSGLRDKVRNTENQVIRQYADNLKQMYKENGWSLEFLIDNYKMHKEKNSGKTPD